MDSKSPAAEGALKDCRGGVASNPGGEVGRVMRFRLARAAFVPPSVSRAFSRQAANRVRSFAIGNWRLLVGRTAKDNDALSLDSACARLLFDGLPLAQQHPPAVPTGSTNAPVALVPRARAAGLACRRAPSRRERRAGSIRRKRGQERRRCCCGLRCCRRHRG